MSFTTGHKVLAAIGLAACAIIAVPPAAKAGAIDWTLSGVTFDDGGTASGSFVTDSSGNITSLTITSTLGTTLPGYVYAIPPDGLFQPSYYPQNANSFLVINVPLYYLNLAFDAPLSVPGTDPISTGALTYECDDCVDVRFVTGGQAIGTAVPAPEPMTLLVLGSGLAGMAAARRRRSGIR
jgi:hypothetical protein